MSTNLEFGSHHWHNLQKDSVRVALSSEEELLYKAKSEIGIIMNLGVMSQLGSILAYGCGDGHQIAGLSNSVGYETNPRDIMIAQQMGVNIIADEKLLPRRHYDVVLCHHFLERVNNIKEHILKMRELIHRKGKIVIVLNENALMKNPKLKSYFQGDDVSLFISLLEDLGLKVVSTKEQFVAGLEKFIFLYKNFGLKTYYNAVVKAGQFTNNREFVFHAILAA
ncbi:MAG: class I SAM-dependent methyltransferase [Cytophagales bacterium]|nr:class I SAM-dependent methyltransferase [Cytophagales bacterium]MDW8385112.1 hypothetical protein [Flammeovirgaceae bacterium]